MAPQDIQFQTLSIVSCLFDDNAGCIETDGPGDGKWNTASNLFFDTFAYWRSLSPAVSIMTLRFLMPVTHAGPTENRVLTEADLSYVA